MTTTPYEVLVQLPSTRRHVVTAVCTTIAWAFDDYAPLTPLFVYNLLPETETFQENTTNASESNVKYIKYRALTAIEAACIEVLKQVLLFKLHEMEVRDLVLPNRFFWRTIAFIAGVQHSCSI